MDYGSGSGSTLYIVRVTLFCRHVVLDEADHMLERGFADQMDAILSECYEESTYDMQGWVLRVFGL